MTDWRAVAWGEESLSEAMLQLVRRAGFAASPTEAVPAVVERGAGAAERDRRIEALADSLGIEAEAIQSSYGELAATLAGIGVALVRIPVGDEHAFLAILGSSSAAVRLLTPRLTVARVPLRELAGLLTREIEAAPRQKVQRWLDAAGVRGRSADRARARLLRETLATRQVDSMWILRPTPGSSFVRQLLHAGLARRVAVFLGAALAQVAVAATSWILVGRGALDGVVERGWLYAWVLLALSSVPVQWAATSSSGRIGIDVATVLRQRLLYGALRIDPDEVRGGGSGTLLGMVNESEALESAALGGALGTITAVVQIASAAAILLAGAGGVLHVALLAGWSAVIAFLAGRFARRRARWTRMRLALTNSFVENVIGNRTRVAQQAPEDHHLREDAALEAYAASSRTMDEARHVLDALPAPGWLALGFVGLLPALATGTPTALGVVLAVGGILQAQSGFGAMTAGLSQIVGAAVAWRSIAKLFDAARDARDAAARVTVVAGEPAAPVQTPVLSLQRVSFRYRPDREPALAACDLVVHDGQRLLLEGPSGGGKSTLAGVMAGLVAPSSGLVRLRGLDRSVVGEAAWRRRVASAPQFHVNHVLSGTLAFNLLMGRAWPATDEDRREAEEVCRELGLGPLLDTMPMGLDQFVGETGWQLSHGERSRIFLARALLQRSELVVLDETFGALDPLTLGRCLDTVMARARSLVVIAHP